MGVILITGRGGAGKTTRCVELLRQKLTKGEKLLFLVPEQDTVETELFLTRALEMPVLWNLDITSPTRLARRIQNEAGGSARVWLSDAGRAMALRSAVSRLSREGGTRYFRSGSQEAADLIGDFMVELKRGESDPLALRLAADQMSPESALAQKLYDLAAIYEEYETALQGKYADGEDALARSTALIEKCASLKELTVFADGFDVLPRTTLRLLSALAAHCRELMITFALGDESDRDAALYEQVRMSLHTFMEMCAEKNVPVTIEHLPDRPLRNPEIEALAKNLYATGVQRQKNLPQHIHVVLARDPYAEAERAAGWLFEQCRVKGRHYRDLAVLCNDMETYGERLRLAFARRRMRVYIDRQRTAAEHPAAQYLLAAMICAARFYRAEDMLRALQSGYVGLSDAEADRLEIYAMEHGLEGSLWEREIEQKPQAEERSLETLREIFVRPIRLFRADGQKRTVEQFAKALVQLMENTQLGEQLEKEYNRCAESGELQRMQVLRQVQEAINSVLDQAVELCGGEAMTLEEFQRFFRAGLESIRIGSIPMSSDAVYVGDPAHFRGRNAQVVYVVGANADVFPARHQDNGLLSEKEKTQLMEKAEQAGTPLRINRLSSRAEVERLVIHNALSAAKEELVLSCAAVDPRGSALRPSPLLLRIRDRIFPGIPTECGVSGDEYIYAGAESTVRETLSEGLRGYLNGAAADKNFMGLLGAYAEVERERCALLLREVQTQVAAQSIEEETAAQLYLSCEKQQRYGVEGLVTGISQLERFALCPFAHFVTYGLRPEELRSPEMDVRERGTLEHSAVEKFSKALYRIDGELDDAGAERLMEEILSPMLDQDAAHRGSGEGLIRAGHSEIRHTLRRMSRLLALQKRLSGFQTSVQEMIFSPRDTEPLELENGEKVYLEGRIDRVDLLKLDGKEYAVAVDYKTGSNALELGDIYYGLRLQLLLYLDVVLRLHAAHPAGLFYQKLGDAQIRLEGSEYDEKSQVKQNKKLRLSGLILEDPAVIRELCREPEWMEQVLPIAPKTVGGKPIEGEFTPASRKKMLSEEDFTVTFRHARRELQTLAQGIAKGRAEVSPARTKEIDACKNCALRSVCGFDESLKGCAYRDLQMDSGTALLKMREEDENA